MSGIRVAIVSVSSALGGSERVLIDLAAQAGANGLEPLVVLPKSGELGAALEGLGVPVVVAPASADFLALSQRAISGPAAMLPLIGGLRGWSRAVGSAVADHFRPCGADPVILYSNGFKAHLACMLARGYRRVWHLHEFPPAFGSIVWRSLAQAVPEAAIANSSAVARAWAGAGRGGPVLVRNGVDTRRFAPTPRTGWVHELLGLPRTARLLGMPAVFARWKGQLEVVDAFAQGPTREVPDAHLVLVGGAIYDTVAERNFAEELIRRVKGGTLNLPGGPRPLSERVHFVKFVPDPWRLYPEFDLVLHFSTRPEPFGRTIVEAMACGVPVIAAKAGGPLEIVEDGVNGWLVPQLDVPALSRAMTSALRSDLAGAGASARRRVEEQFSVEGFARGVADVVRRVHAASAE